MLPLRGVLLYCPCGTGEGMLSPGAVVAWAGVGEPVGKPVGNPLAVANGNSGVAVGPGVAVLNPEKAGGVDVKPGRGGFCQI